MHGVRSYPSGGSCDPVLSSFASVVEKSQSLGGYSHSCLSLFKKTDMSPNASINSRLEPRDNFFVLGLPSSIFLTRLLSPFELKSHSSKNPTQQP